MSNSAAASYKPDCQVITLKSIFDSQFDPDHPEEFASPEQIAIYLHEWIHYFHNVSTVAGVATFSQLVALWSNFRGTFDESGWSRGKSISAPSEIEDMERQYKYIGTWRLSVPNSLPNGITVSNYTFISADLISKNTSYPGQPQLAVLECTVSFQKSMDLPAEQHNVTIGLNEILESAAFMLEELAATNMGILVAEPLYDPYRLVVGLAGLLAPNLERLDVLKAAIVSLQHPDPPRILKHLLILAENAIAEGQDPSLKLLEVGKEILEQTLPSSLESLAQIDEIFPLDQPMGNAVKYTASCLRKNLNSRKEDLFLEITLVNRLKHDRSVFGEYIKKFGRPVVILEREGEENEIGRDLLYERTDLEEKDNKGWGMMNAAFRFVTSHFTNNSIYPSALLNPTRCTFFSVCTANFRKDKPHICSKEPWLSSFAHSSECAYSVAVIITR